MVDEIIELEPEMRKLRSANDPNDDYVDIEAGEGIFTTEEDEDGNFIVSMGGEEDEPELGGSGEFYENLADGVIPEAIMQTIATDLLQRIEQDREDRKERDKQYEDGIRRTGLAGDAPGGAQFTGASRVVHPMLIKACIDFCARVMKEMWPEGSDGPCKPNVAGKVTREKDDSAVRKSDYMNYQLNTLIKEARQTFETTLIQVPLGGSQYIRLWYDHGMKRPRMRFVGVDKVILPSNSDSFYTARRRTWLDTIDFAEYEARVASGMYSDAKLPRQSMTPERTRSQKASDRVEGVSADGGMNYDGNRQLVEVMTYLPVTAELATYLDYEERGKSYPYLITIDEETKRVLSCYRDWEEDDDGCEPINQLFEFSFLPWRGAVGLSLPQALAGLPGAATGALRALLDSAQIANMQGGFILKGSGTSGQSRQPSPGEFVEIEGGMETPDIRSKVMAFATTQPSEMLLKLLAFCVESSESVVRTALDDAAVNSPSNTPVGTQLSRVEQGLAVFTFIHGRIHSAFDRFLTGLERLNRLYMDDTESFDSDGEEVIVYRGDFAKGTGGTSPISDPSICSDQQRHAQMAALKATAVAFPNLLNVRKVIEREMNLWKIPDADELFMVPDKPEEMNAIYENFAMMTGSPVAAFPDQDHLAHLQAHFDFAKSPVLGANPLIAPRVIPPMIAHCIEHIGYHYVSAAAKVVERSAMSTIDDLAPDDVDIRQELDRLLSLVSQHVVPEMESNFEAAMPVLQQMMQTMQQFAPPPPVDPGVLAVQVAQSDIQRKAQNDQAMGALKAQQLQMEAARAASRDQIEAQRIAAGERTAAAERELKLLETQMDNATAERIAMNRAVSPHFTNGRSMAHAR